MQGVRQLAPSEVFASAPGGSDSMVSETFAALPMLGTQSQLGVQLEQPASMNAPATAPTRTRPGIRTITSPASPADRSVASLRANAALGNVPCGQKAADARRESRASR